MLPPLGSKPIPTKVQLPDLVNKAATAPKSLVVNSISVID